MSSLRVDRELRARFLAQEIAAGFLVVASGHLIHRRNPADAAGCVHHFNGNLVQVVHIARKLAVNEHLPFDSRHDPVFFSLGEFEYKRVREKSRRQCKKDKQPYP